jgi:uncharacterized protein YprB with RNaseH-like and TPR domain
MDLSRLRSIVHGGAMPRDPAVPPRRELTYEPVGPDGLPIEPRSDVVLLDGGSWAQTAHGPVVVFDHEFPPEFLHGRVAVEELADWDPQALAVVGGRPLDVCRPGDESGAADADASGPAYDAAGAGTPPAAPVFFDLETTGISGGAGTVPFLVGCGYFHRGAFRTRQFFLHGFSAERALLHAVTDFVSRAPLLVTYNGRTFDVPVMETRWLFHRMRVALEDVPHLDMLPPSRRLWRDAAESAQRSCRLVSLETLLCGVMRVGDVPGVEIPGRYFEYVRHGDTRLLEPVLYHNRMDLLSLAALTARAQRLVREGADAAMDAVECVALGRLLERRGDRIEAERCYRRVIADPFASARQREDARHALARLLRRARRFREAAAVWRDVVAHGVGRSEAVRDAVEALAVHHEHRERDLAQARSLALRALQSERDSRRRAAVTYRLARLDRKLARECGATQPRLIVAE